MSWKDLGTDSEFANRKVGMFENFPVREFGVCPQIFPRPLIPYGVAAGINRTSALSLDAS